MLVVLSLHSIDHALGKPKNLRGRGSDEVGRGGRCPAEEGVTIETLREYAFDL